MHTPFSFGSWFSRKREWPFFQGKLPGGWAPGRAGLWRQYSECRSSGFPLWDMQSPSLLQRESSVFCSCIWFSLWLSVRDLVLSLEIGLLTCDGIHRRSQWFSMGRIQRMGWAIALSFPNRTYTGDDFVAIGLNELTASDERLHLHLL